MNRLLPSQLDRRHLLGGLACLLPSLIGCASYRFGNSTLYAANVRTIYVPLFQCDSFRVVPAVDLGERLTVEMNLQVLVTWADRGGTVLASGAVPVPAASVDVGQSAALVPEYGRSVISTQQEGIVKMAQQIVGLMEEPW
ncbi:MAG: hypothetical protein EBS83_00300 [Planctomycetia bacterium]|nr:hypothetical protein [Planctomycetia bacterium]